MHPKILVVEDDDFLREIYIESLTEIGAIVENCRDGQEAYDKMKQGGYDVVILDIMLPKMNGLEVMRKLHEETLATPNKKVVFVTNLDRVDILKEAFQLADDCWIKSQLTPGDFVKKVKLLLPNQGL